MKKNIKMILGIVIGMVLVSGISVYATLTYTAGNISYTKSGETTAITVESALNELYAKMSMYKKLDIKTNATADDILSGKTAYNNLGNLITGKITTNNISGSHVWTQNDSDNGFKICDFTPSCFAITGVSKQDNSRTLWYYNNQISTDSFYSINLTKNTINVFMFSNTNSFSISDGLKLKWNITNWNGQTVNYMVVR